MDIKERCPFALDIKLYKNCYSLGEACRELGYNLSCDAGYEPDLSQTCPYDSLYIRCIPTKCLGYNYTLAEAQEPGYQPDGEPSLSGTQKKYKRKVNSCNGFEYDASNCGNSSCGSLEGDTCQSGETLKYKKCRPCTTPSACTMPSLSLESYWCQGAMQCLIKK